MRISHQDKVEPKEQEKKLAMQLIDSLAAKFEPEKYRDEYQESMRAMIAAKQKGQEVTATVHPQRAPVIDLMDALRKSINAKPAASSKRNLHCAWYLLPRPPQKEQEGYGLVPDGNDGPILASRISAHAGRDREAIELLGKIAAGGAAKKGRRKVVRFSGPDYPAVPQNN